MNQKTAKLLRRFVRAFREQGHLAVVAWRGASHREKGRLTRWMRKQVGR